MVLIADPVSRLLLTDSDGEDTFVLGAVVVAVAALVTDDDDIVVIRGVRVIV